MTRLSLVDGFWCEVSALVPACSFQWNLGGYRASSPRMAIRWLRGQGERLSAALDPVPQRGVVFPPCALQRVDTPGLPNPGHIIRAWTKDMWTQGEQMEALSEGRHIAITAGGPDNIVGWTDVDVFYSLTARPIAVTFTPGRKLREPEHIPV